MRGNNTVHPAAGRNMGCAEPLNDVGGYCCHPLAGGAACTLHLRPMDTKPPAKSYLASGERIGIRPWGRRDRSQISRWPPYQPALPPHWTAAAAPSEGARSSYAVDLLAAPPADRLIGRISVRVGSRIMVGIVIHPDHLGGGLGTESLLILKRVVTSLGLAELHLDVSTSNPRAVRCYMRAGFVVVGTVWRDDYCYLDMSCTL